MFNKQNRKRLNIALVPCVIGGFILGGVQPAFSDQPSVEEQLAQSKKIVKQKETKLENAKKDSEEAISVLNDALKAYDEAATLEKVVELKTETWKLALKAKDDLDKAQSDYDKVKAEADKLEATNQQLIKAQEDVRDATSKVKLAQELKQQVTALEEKVEKASKAQKDLIKSNITLSNLEDKIRVAEEKLPILEAEYNKAKNDAEDATKKLSEKKKQEELVVEKQELIKTIQKRLLDLEQQYETGGKTDESIRLAIEAAKKDKGNFETELIKLQEQSKQLGDEAQLQEDASKKDEILTSMNGKKEEIEKYKNVLEDVQPLKELIVQSRKIQQELGSANVLQRQLEEMVEKAKEAGDLVQLQEELTKLEEKLNTFGDVATFEEKLAKVGAETEDLNKKLEVAKSKLASVGEADEILKELVKLSKKSNDMDANALHKAAKLAQLRAATKLAITERAQGEYNQAKEAEKLAQANFDKNKAEELDKNTEENITKPEAEKLKENKGEAEKQGETHAEKQGEAEKQKENKAETQKQTETQGEKQGEVQKQSEKSEGKVESLKPEGEKKSETQGEKKGEVQKQSEKSEGKVEGVKPVAKKVKLVNTGFDVTSILAGIGMFFLSGLVLLSRRGKNKK